MMKMKPSFLTKLRLLFRVKRKLSISQMGKAPHIIHYKDHKNIRHIYKEIKPDE